MSSPITTEAPWVLTPKEQADLNGKIIVHQTAMYVYAAETIYGENTAEIYYTRKRWVLTRAEKAIVKAHRKSARIRRRRFNR